MWRKQKALYVCMPDCPYAPSVVCRCEYTDCAEFQFVNGLVIVSCVLSGHYIWQQSGKEKDAKVNYM